MFSGIVFFLCVSMGGSVEGSGVGGVFGTAAHRSSLQCYYQCLSPQPIQCLVCLSDIFTSLVSRRYWTSTFFGKCRFMQVRLLMCRPTCSCIPSISFTLSATCKAFWRRQRNCLPVKKMCDYLKCTISIYLYKYVYYTYEHIFVLHSIGMCHSASNLRQTGDVGPLTALLYALKSLKFYGWALFFLCS